MEIIKDSIFGGERPLFGSNELYLENVKIEPGESALKNCSNIEAVKCRFEGKYPFWHVDNFIIRDCLFTEGARAALWYSRGCRMYDTRVEAPKMFRELHGIELEHVVIPDADETLWHCTDIKIRDVEVKNAPYIFMHCENIDIDRYRQEGNYSFQYCRNVVIRNAEILSKDAFWNTENVTVYDSVIDGEYLGWYSKNLHLVRCTIGGTQPLCYTEGLVLEDCRMMESCDLAFEDSEVTANILTPITSVKNPRTGRIVAPSYGEIILDKFRKSPADCQILTNDEV